MSFTTAAELVAGSFSAIIAERVAGSSTAVILIG